MKAYILGSLEKALSKLDKSFLPRESSSMTWYPGNLSATDFSEECRAPFAKAQKFAMSMGATTHLLLINTPSGFKTTAEAREIMENFVRGTAAQKYTLNLYNDISVEKGVLNFAKETGAQLIGMATHGRKGLAHFFNGSISEDMVNHANMPVITFKI